MDDIRQIGKYVRRSRDGVDIALERIVQKNSSRFRIRDFMSPTVPYQMFFKNTPEQRVFLLDMYFDDQPLITGDFAEDPIIDPPGYPPYPGYPTPPLPPPLPPEYPPAPPPDPNPPPPPPPTDPTPPLPPPPAPEPGQRITAPGPTGGDDTATIMAFIRNNRGRPIRLYPNAIYRFYHELPLFDDCADTDMDQAGAQCRAIGYHNGMAIAGRNIRWTDSVTWTRPNWVGSHPQPGMWLGPSVGEDAHVIHTMGSIDTNISNIWGDAFQGDGIWVAYRPVNLGGAAGSSTTRLTVNQMRVSNNGRMGIAINAGVTIRAYNMQYHNVAFHIIDLEPERSNWMQQQERDVIFDGAVATGWCGGGTFPPLGASPIWIGLPGNAVTPPGTQFFPIVDGITIRNHHFTSSIQLGMLSQLVPDTGDFRLRNITIENNTADRWGAGPAYAPGVVYGHSTDNLTVRNNTQKRGGGPALPPSFVSMSNSNNVQQSGNEFINV